GPLDGMAVGDQLTGLGAHLRTLLPDPARERPDLLRVDVHDVLLTGLLDSCPGRAGGNLAPAGLWRRTRRQRSTGASRSSASLISAPSPAKDIRRKRPPSAVSKSTPGATATPVVASRWWANAIVSS